MNLSDLRCEGCKATEPTFLCPKCKELRLKNSFFCSQPCFTKNWKDHKRKHETIPSSAHFIQNPDPSSFIFTGNLRPGQVSPPRFVPSAIKRPDYAMHPEGRSFLEENEKKDHIKRHDTKVIRKIRKACRLAREVLNIALQQAKIGTATDFLDQIVHEETIARGMYPSPLGYYGFPKSVCTSVNEVICHGIPDSYRLQNGDIINLDVSCFLDGVHADLSETIFVGEPSEEVITLVECSYQSLMNAISICKPGCFYRDIGNVIEKHAHLHGCSVTRSYCGHGVAEKFHGPPTIPHYAHNKAVGVMTPGHVFTIEPMINQGSWKDITWPDKWTSVTIDGKYSAQFEHTLLIANEGVEILTENADGPYFKKQLG